MELPVNQQLGFEVAPYNICDAIKQNESKIAQTTSIVFYIPYSFQ